MVLKEAKKRCKIPIPVEIDLNPRKSVIQNGLTIKREVIQRVGGYDPLFEWGEEWDLTIRLLRIGARIYRPRARAYFTYHIRSERYLKWTMKFLLHDLSPRELIFAGNFLCFLFKYGPWYIKFNPRHFVSFLLRLWLLYSLLGIAILPAPAFISFSLAVIANLVACKIRHKTLRLGFLLDQILKALGEHRNLFRSIFYRYRRKHSDRLQYP